MKVEKKIISPPIQNPESGREKRKFAFIAATPEMTALQERNDFSFLLHLKHFAQ